MSENTSAEIGALSFEQALEQLEAIVGKLESGSGTLDDAINAYARGAELKAHCQKKLDEARMKVEKIRRPDGDGAVSAEPFDS
ncbi:MAG: exodeoxyribonuclease VII small subunit [Nisaea sp.]|uniref:exodeoxyribonuclease VII small subunit n=1 Tax=Nisaea sp. TaxID=2024842 RepID=UPI001B12EA01|nr:exodeoxyribonuclease VII small subunit [Nisaea sp.]MBO6559628.1 exodeoxyribonuclease VII small subunit [Nisaea sp.]